MRRRRGEGGSDGEEDEERESRESEEAGTLPSRVEAVSLKRPAPASSGDDGEDAKRLAPAAVSSVLSSHPCRALVAGGLLSEAALASVRAAAAPGTLLVLHEPVVGAAASCATPESWAGEWQVVEASVVEAEGEAAGEATTAGALGVGETAQARLTHTPAAPVRSAEARAARQLACPPPRSRPADNPMAPATLTPSPPPSRRRWWRR